MSNRSGLDTSPCPWLIYHGIFSGSDFFTAGGHWLLQGLTAVVIYEGLIRLINYT
jgi:hypothetical protein